MLSSKRSIAAYALALILPIAPLLGASAPAAADDLSDEGGLRLGLDGRDDYSGGLLGFLDREKLTHSRSLMFGYATTTGAARAESGMAAYTDFFGYRLSDAVRLNLAMQYRLDSTSRTLQADEGSFSVLPSFSLQYNPSDNTLIQLSYGRFGCASPFALGRSTFPY